MRTSALSPAGTVFTLLIFTVANSFSQTQFGSAMPDEAERGGGGDTLYVPPGLSFTTCYYHWVISGTPTTGDFVLAAPTSWVDSVYAPVGQTSNDCLDPFPIVVRIQAPMAPGVYTSDVVDLNAGWPGWTIVMKVADLPTQIDGVLTDTLLVGQFEQTPATADGSFGVTDVGCVPLPYYPTSEITFEYTFHPAAAWITMNPDSVVVPAGTTVFPMTDVQSNVAGSFTTYRYRTQTWYGRPQVLQYNGVFLLNTSVPHPSSGVEALQLHPNPASGLVTIRMPQGQALFGEVVFTDIAGHEVRRVVADTQQGLTYVDVSSFSPGAYTCRMRDVHTGQLFTCRVIIAP